MKFIIFLLLLTTLYSSCRDKKQPTDEVMMPVEADGGIGDGAPSLDSLLETEKDTVHTHTKDSL